MALLGTVAESDSDAGPLAVSAEFAMTAAPLRCSRCGKWWRWWRGRGRCYLGEQIWLSHDWTLAQRPVRQAFEDAWWKAEHPEAAS